MCTSKVARRGGRGGTMARKIVITSGKGGVGKTTVCANLGLALAKKSKRVLLADLDMGLNNLDVTTCVENKIVYDLVDVVEQKCRPSQALVQVEAEPTLYVLPSCHPSRRPVSPDAAGRVVDKLSDSFDYVLLDCPAGIDSGFRRAVACADEGILVVTPHLSAVRDADKALCELKKTMCYVGVIVNRVRGDLIADGEMLSAFEVFSLLDASPLGIIPENDELNCRGMQGYRRPFDIVANNLQTGARVMYDCVSPYRGLFGRLKRAAKRHR